MSGVSQGNSSLPKLFHISKTVEKSIKDVHDGMAGKRQVYPTSWPRLNRNLMGGLQPGKMYVIAGRPGVGKSAFSNCHHRRWTRRHGGGSDNDKGRS